MNVFHDFLRVLGLGTAPAVAPASTGQLYFDTVKQKFLGSENVGAYGIVLGQCLYGTYASRPAPGFQGRIFRSSDGAVEFVDDGTVWRPYIGGRSGKQIPLVAAFTQYGAATFTDMCGAIVGATAIAGGAASGLVQAKNAASELILHVSQVEIDDNGWAGIVVRDSATQAQVIAGVAFNNYGIYRFSDDNTPVGAVITREMGTGPCWFRFVDDGVAFHTWYRSVDGISWNQFFQNARAAVIPGGGDQIGIALNRSGGPYALFDSYDLIQ